ncbi:protein MODIFIER OF SNC1 1 isoform X1 [Senna tora]|uniref:Protein MODIFIER OF SNC1 1 isoform X1 n=1 Tax=Senna tora TaxID=362788 RepID=A0A835CGT2_9FABA|nr:protein MODIFIER OF SNC1 1 isoform X1 [Senna tora]
MSSNMLSGERRWASSRRSGMTVLGKVAVPKPINLPSQRLENHGLDPNVEIVPKLRMFVLLGVMCSIIILLRGTLGWGGRSSSAPNAWGSSLSPNTDGGSSSSSGLSARPSSGGSGMRPSTAGSDRALEPTSNAWGSNSRPSSASGSLTSNQTPLTSLRPHSAETRPGSSQLSRLTENHVAWSDARTAEKLGVAHGKNDEFSLTSGEFPTLGSEKEKLADNSELQDHNSHGRPSSSSGNRKAKTETSVADDAPVTANLKDEAINSWRRDYPAYREEGLGPSSEKWQGNAQHYPNASFPPQHYDAWHNPPINNPQGGVWFRGPPGGPQFGNPVAPSGFPIEPFAYYGPHIPPTALANPIVPPPGPGPRGTHPKSGDVYRPHMPDAYICPGPSMPIRTGFYPGPMSYDGYYSPAMGFCNSNEQDVPYMAMPAGPSVYNRYPNQNPLEPGNPRGRSGGYSSAEKPLVSEQVESSHPSDSSGPYRVLLKQHNGQDGRNDQLNWEDSQAENSSQADRRNQSRMSSAWENEQCSDYRKHEEIKKSTSAHCEESFSQTLEKQGSSSSVVVKAKSPEITANINTAGDISARKFYGPLGAATGVQDVLLEPSAPKDVSLISKTEGLNAKSRDNSSSKSREDQRNKFHTGNAPLSHAENEDGISAGGVFPGTTRAAGLIKPSPPDVGSGGDKNPEYFSFRRTTPSRRIAHGMQGRNDHRNKGRYSNHDADGWQKKSVCADSSTSSDQPIETSNIHVGDHLLSVEMYKRSGSYHIHRARNDVEPPQTVSDPTDSQAQRSEIVSTTTIPLKVENDTMVDGTLPSEIARHEVGTTCGSGLSTNLTVVTESSVNQKKKNNRNGKNRHKVEETSSRSALPLVAPNDVTLSQNFAESDKPKDSESKLDQDSVPLASSSKDLHQQMEQRNYLPNEDSHGRANSQWKSQHARRMPRNTQATRPAEKPQGGDAVVMWTPVKPPNKTEMTGASIDNNKTDVVNPIKSDQQGHNKLKSKRAELERYIPKPVAKEMVQHGCIQQVSSSNNQDATNEFVGQADFGSQAPQMTQHTNTPVVKVVSGVESKNRDGRQIKPGKLQGSWRQRGSTESTSVYDMKELNHGSKSDQSVQRSFEHKRTQKIESLEKGQTKHVSDSSDPDGSNKASNCNLATFDSNLDIQDQRVTGRGKRVPFRGNRSMGMNDDAECRNHDGETVKIETQISSSEHIEPEVSASSKENRVVRDRQMSHWQPKSQVSNNHRGNRPQVRNDPNHTKAYIAPPHQDDQCISKNSKAGEAPKLGIQEAKRERRNAQSKGHTHPPSQVHDSSVEEDPTSVDLRYEQHPTFGFHRNGNRNRFGKGHESQEDWKAAGQDNRHYKLPANRERQGQNLHYEYHPVGPNDNNQSNQFERPKDGNHTGGRLRERGQTYSRRGNALSSAGINEDNITPFGDSGGKKSFDG